MMMILFDPEEEVSPSLPLPLGNINGYNIQEVPAQEKMDMRPPYAIKTLTDPPPLLWEFPTP
jgi:hypothetical protein